MARGKGGAKSPVSSTTGRAKEQRSPSSKKREHESDGASQAGEAPENFHKRARLMVQHWDLLEKDFFRPVTHYDVEILSSQVWSQPFGVSSFGRHPR
jgi:hypothetical protein